ncbi:hypothetical protein ACFOTD_13300 [Cohnella sp. GCM10012308]
MVDSFNLEVFDVQVCRIWRQAPAWEAFDLRERYPCAPNVRADGLNTILELPEANADLLYIGKRD